MLLVKIALEVLLLVIVLLLVVLAILAVRRLNSGRRAAGATPRPNPDDELIHFDQLLREHELMKEDKTKESRPSN
jgi:hypothetical protein